MNKIKVFQGLENYGTQAGFFSNALREKGIPSISATFPDPYKRQIDVELLHGGTYFLKIFKHSYNRLRMVCWFFKYNTFHFYFGRTFLKNQRDLPLYHFFGKKVVMEYLGYDVQLYQYSIDKYELTNVRFYKDVETSKLSDERKIKRLKFETQYIDKQLVCAPYLSEFVEDSEVLPLAIDLSKYQYTPKTILGNEIVIMHAPTNRGNKGTEFILAALNKLIDEGFNIRILLVENISHDELKLKYKECDIFIDQIVVGWYGTASIEAMAIGRPTCCFIRESYFEHIDYGQKIPIINVLPTTVYSVIKDLILNKDKLVEIGLNSRRFVEEIHDLNKVTDHLINIYNKL